jgi:hypothetical protein
VTRAVIGVLAGYLVWTALWLVGNAVFFSRRRMCLRYSWGVDVSALPQTVEDRR